MNLNDERLQLLFENYAKNRIFNHESFKNDTDKVFKLVVLRDLYEDKIKDDLILLHYIKKIHGSVKLYKLLNTPLVTNIPTSMWGLIVQEKEGSFGYDIIREEFRYCKTVKRDGSEYFSYIHTDLSTGTDILEKLRVETVNDFIDLGKLDNFVHYAEYEVEFLSKYLDWSRDFNTRYSHWMKSE